LPEESQQVDHAYDTDQNRPAFGDFTTEKPDHTDSNQHGPKQTREARVVEDSGKAGKQDHGRTVDKDSAPRHPILLQGH
jgi:hypothetical protein